MKAFSLLSAVAIFFLPVFASADSFNWTFGGGPDSMTGSGTLDATAIADGSGNYDITDGTGTVGNTDGSGLSYSVNFGNCTYPAACVLEDADGTDLSFDNVLVGGTGLDNANGVLLESTDPTTGNPVYFNIWGNPAGEFNDLPSGSGWNETNLVNGFTTVDMTTSSTIGEAPQASHDLYSGGFALAGFPCLRRRRQRRPLAEYPRRRPQDARQRCS